MPGHLCWHLRAALPVPGSWSCPLAEGELCPARTIRFSLCIKNRAQTRGEINPRTEQDGFVVAFGNTVETCVVVPCFLSCWVWKPAKNHKGGCPAAAELSAAVILDIIEQ